MKILSIIFIGFVLTILLPISVYGESNELVNTTITFSDKYLITDFDIPSSLVQGGEITDYKIYTDFKLLMLELNTWDDGQLTITLPRTLIDAVLENGEDDEFFVLVDGTETEFKESRNTLDRIISVSFPKGTQEIFIIGTSVIPEFDEMVIIVLGGSILLFIIISKKFNFNLISNKNN